MHRLNILSGLITLLIVAQPAAAVEIGDMFHVSNGVERTVTKIITRNKNGVDLQAQILKANAREHCEHFQMLQPGSKAMTRCVAKTIGKPERYKVVCPKPAITVAGVTYRPADPHELAYPWNAINKPHEIIKGEDLFKKACDRNWSPHLEKRAPAICARFNRFYVSSRYS